LVEGEVEARGERGMGEGAKKVTYNARLIKAPARK
jgi:hypothetical protein